MLSCWIYDYSGQDHDLTYLFDIHNSFGVILMSFKEKNITWFLNVILVPFQLLKLLTKLDLTW